MADVSFTILRFAYLILLWVFVLSTIALLRKDIFGKQSSELASIQNGALAVNPNQIPALNPLATAIPASGVTVHANQLSASQPHHSSNFEQNTTPRSLLVTAGIAEGDEIIFEHSDDLTEITIGRGNDNDIALSDNYASTHHARLFKRDHQWYIEDTDSTNGTIVDGKGVHAPISLHIGSRIQIGKNIMELR